MQKKGRPCVAATRTGEFVGDASKLVTVAKGDVTDAASLEPLITEQTGAVIRGSRLAASVLSLIHI